MESNTEKQGQKKRSPDTKTLVTLSMLAAIAFVSAWLIKINIFGFLSLEPKDTVLAVTGFLFGPWAAFFTAAAVSLAEMLLISSTGIIGFVMNILSSAAFVLPAALLYKRSRTLKSAVTGLILGTVIMTAVMLVWNYLITPLYMNTSREAVKALLPTVFLPFNLIKGCLNAGLTMLVYKPGVQALKKAHLLPAVHENRGERKQRSSLTVIVCTALIVAACAVTVFLLKTGN